MSCRHRRHLADPVVIANDSAGCRVGNSWLEPHSRYHPLNLMNGYLHLHDRSVIGSDDESDKFLSRGRLPRNHTRDFRPLLATGCGQTDLSEQVPGQFMAFCALDPPECRLFALLRRGKSRRMITEADRMLPACRPCGYMDIKAVMGDEGYQHTFLPSTSITGPLLE